MGALQTNIHQFASRRVMSMCTQTEQLVGLEPGVFLSQALRLLTITG